MDILATVTVPPPSSPDSALFMGMLVIALLQLSQFFFAWRKDQRSSEAAKKEDLTTLRAELKKDIGDVAADVDQLKDSLEKKLEASRLESERARGEMDKSLHATALKTATLIEGMETLKQTTISTSSKVDRLLQRHS